jgi:serine protease inhibitor
MVKEEIFLILLLAFNLNNISSYIVLPFSFSLKNNNFQKFNLNSNPKDYFEYYINNTIYSKIKVNDQLFTFRL